MSHRKHREPRTERDDTAVEAAPPQRYAWIVYAVAMLLVGGLGGYVLSISTAPGAPAASAVTQAPGASVPASGMVDEVALKAYRDILARDPKNAQAAVSGFLYLGHA